MNTKTTTSADWRHTISTNQTKTALVISCFIAIYAGLGFLIDLYIHGAFISSEHFDSVFHALITFQTTPKITLILAAVAVISLWVTYAFSDRLMLFGTEYYEINPETARNLQERQLYNVVEELKIAAGLHYMPKVFLIEADYMNAFASGYSEKSAMIAITRGLLEKLNRDEVQAVLAHELSHIRHADIKLTLTAAVLSNLILIVLDFLFYSMLTSSRSDNEDRNRGGNGLIVVVMIARYVLPIITMLLMLFLSRTREYMADAGAVELTRTNQPLARALLKISGDYHHHADHYADEYRHTPNEDVRRASYIFDPMQMGINPMKSISSLFSTHPPIDERLKALGFNSKDEL